MIKPVFLYAKIFMTGAIVLGLELAASRVLTPFFGVSLYVWSAILSVTLIALALGYQGGGILAKRAQARTLLILFAAAGGLAGAWMMLTVWTYPFLFWPLANFDLVSGSIIASLYLLFVPLIILSALNPLLIALLAHRDEGDRGAGQVFFVSTIGSVLGVFAVAYGMVPFLTNYKTITALAGFSSILSVVYFMMLADFKNLQAKIYFALSVLGAAAAIATFVTGGLEMFGKNIQHESANWKLTEARPSYFGVVQIVDIQVPNRYPARALFNDGLTQNQFLARGVSGTLYTYALEEMALAAAEYPEKALVLGIGAGVVPMSYARAGLKVHAVDINPAIVELAQKHLDFEPSLMTIGYEDARTAVRHCDHDYDIVAVDLFRGDGIPEHLVTSEFFNDIKGCMKSNGVMVMNSFMSLKDPRAEQALIKTVAHVFGEVHVAQRPVKEGHDFTVAYLLARKDAPVGEFSVNANDMPSMLDKDFRATMDNGRLLNESAKELADVQVLTDLSNRWKNLADNMEIDYRRSVVEHLPWQILMN